MENPRRSEELVLNEIRNNGGLTIKQAIKFTYKENLWFGPGQDVIDILDRNEKVGIIKSDSRGKYRVS